MSDGALSQDEIDALLAGVDSAGMGSSPAPAAGMMAGGLAGGNSEEDRRAIQDFLTANVGAMSSNISMMMSGATAGLREPQVSFANRDMLLGQLSDMVTVARADFSSGFPGEHVFVLPEDTARSIASLMNVDDAAMGEMAMSVIAELVSQLVATQIKDLEKKTNNKSIAYMAPEAVNIRKAAAALPAGDFLSAVYPLDLGDGKPHQICEVYGGGIASDIAKALNGTSQPAPGMPAMGGSAMPAMGGAMPGMPAMGGAMGGGMGMPAMGGGMGMGMPAMGGGMGMPGMGMGMPGMGGGMGMGMPGMGAPTNVQTVQFPNLMPRATHQEMGNIGLIMDVFMEMTVELGRTRKLIKEILGMGEGTIIELDKLAGEPVDILVNHKLIAKGEVVVIDENFGVRVTEIVSPMERLNDLG